MLLLFFGDDDQTVQVYDTLVRTNKGYRGVNLSGNELAGSAQGSTKPTYDYFKSKGLTLVRLPFDWTEVQPTLYGALDETAMSFIDNEIEYARINKMRVILDMHNSGKRGIYYVDSAEIPMSAWSNFWTRLSKRYRDVETVIGYDHHKPGGFNVQTSILNYSQAVADANRVPVATNTKIIQAILSAIRANGDDKYIVAELDNGASIHTFTQYYGVTPEPWIVDSLFNERIIYAGHYYFDPDHSGNYAMPDMPTEQTINDEVIPFLRWCQQNNKPCYITEYGAPNYYMYTDVLDYFLSLLDTYNAWATYWKAGDNVTSDLSIQPTVSYSVDKFHMQTIINHLQYRQWEKTEKPRNSDRLMDITDTWEDYDKQWEDNYTAVERPGSPIY